MALSLDLARNLLCMKEGTIGNGITDARWVGLPDVRNRIDDVGCLGAVTVGKIPVISGKQLVKESGKSRVKY